MDYSKLSDYCAWNSPERVTKLLNDNKQTIDILDREGELFKIAFGHNLDKIVAVLIEYYEKTYLKDDQHSYEYIYRKKLLIDIINEAIDSTCHDISSEIKLIIGKYLEQENNDADSTNEEDFVADFHDSEEGAKEEDFSQDLSLEELHNNLVEQPNTTHLIGEQTD